MTENIQEITENANENANMALAMLKSLSTSVAEVWLAVIVMTIKLQSTYPRDMSTFAEIIQEGVKMSHKQTKQQHENN